LCGAPELRGRLAEYGDRLGMAFQIVDDILDYTEDESVTGKPGGLDLREHKVTLPLIATLGCASAADRSRIDELFAAEMPDDELIADVIEIVERNGGIEYARRRGGAFANDAERALHALPHGPVRAALTDAIAYVMDRRS
jgi:octaprenyl-diphosphate synthase